ncbi:MAG: hypothetical protein GOV00_04385 [Candidatus Altiarchaeota archaeon]|nr:hypothetical protein [Candidatus Altiarchaeota archaeon]
MSVIALDLDRVLFDTNKYLVFLRKKFEETNLNFDDVVSKSADRGRKDLTTMVNIVAEELGKERAENLFFENVETFWKNGLAEIFKPLREKFDKIFVITVGDGYQSRKISGLDLDGIFVVDCDDKKVKVACALHEKYPDLIFIDDKPSVVNAMIAKDIKSLQAMWFLDEEHRKNPLDAHLNKAVEILEI